MARIHVFTIDWVPRPTDIASGGGLRSLQIIEALRSAGHSVTYSVPAECRHVRRLGRQDASLQEIEFHTQHNQLDLLRKLRPQIVVWLPTLIRTIPFTGSGDLIHVCDILGLPHVEAAIGAAGLEAANRARLVNLCAHADLVLTGSEEQNGYWLAELSRDRPPPPTAIVPYALPASLRLDGAVGSARLARLHVTGMVYAWSTSIHLLGRVADWVAQRNDVTLSAILGTDPGGATDRAVLKELQSIATRPRVEMPGEVSFSQAMSDYRAGSVSLDIYEPNLERRMAVPIRTVNALTHRVPVLSTVDGTLTRRLQMEDAGLLLMHGPHDPIEAMLDRVADLPAADLARMSDAAHRFAQREYSAEAAASTLVNAIEEAVERRAATSGARLARRPVSGSAPRPPHVLVISNVEPHHRELRVDIPFSAMFGRQLIDGFSIWSDGDFKFTTSSNVAEQVFDAIWVQRKITPEAAVALASLGRKFVYDIDDNLLATPGFRPAFSIESMQTVRNMISSSAVLSCSTARLAHLLQSVSGLPLVDKVVVTPNLLREPPPPPPSGPPGFLVWVSSDTPALTDSRAAVIKAIRDFCLAYGTRLACLGAPPPDLLTESEVEIVHVRQVPYASYLSLLRSFAPAIMACPMEAETDPATARFIDGKSDIKMLEALAGGLVGVFSRAHPYLDSDLPDAIMCDNTYAGWMEALGRAWQRSQRPVESPAIPVHRYASDTGISPWLAAIERVRLAVPLGCAEFRDALTLLQGRYGRRLLSEAEFEEDFYLKTYPDIRLALSSGMMPSAYSHYQADGYREGRMGRETDALEPHNEHFWANLLHTLGDMRVAVTNQDRHLEALKARRAARLRLRQA